jgi:DHA1 family bicyclomycin/chloramphenicol resistance-like MFS transporter
MIVTAVSIYATIALFLLAVTVSGVDSLPVLMVLLFCSFANLGLVIPTTAVLSLEEHGPIAGMASALGGTLQMVTGAGSIVVASLLYDGTPQPMVAVIALCATGALILAWGTLGRERLAPAAAE